MARPDRKIQQLPGACGVAFLLHSGRNRVDRSDVKWLACFGLMPEREAYGANAVGSEFFQENSAITNAEAPLAKHRNSISLLKFYH